MNDLHQLNVQSTGQNSHSVRALRGHRYAMFRFNSRVPLVRSSSETAVACETPHPYPARGCGGPEPARRTDRPGTRGAEDRGSKPPLNPTAPQPATGHESPRSTPAFGPDAPGSAPASSGGTPGPAAQAPRPGGQGSPTPGHGAPDPFRKRTATHQTPAGAALLRSQSHSFSRSYGANLPTSLTHVILLD